MSDGIGLEDTQEVGGADAHTSVHFVNIENMFASKIIEEVFQPQTWHHLGDSFGKINQAVSNGHQVFENQICGP